jgi:hypothetical protein
VQKPGKGYLSRVWHFYFAHTFQQLNIIFISPPFFGE